MSPVSRTQSQTAISALSCASRSRSLLTRSLSRACSLSVTSCQITRAPLTASPSRMGDALAWMMISFPAAVAMTSGRSTSSPPASARADGSSAGDSRAPPWWRY